MINVLPAIRVRTLTFAYLTSQHQDVMLVLFRWFFFLGSCLGRELKWQVNTNQAGYICGAISKQYTLKVWKWTNPHRSGPVQYWFLSLYPMFPPLSGPWGLISYALCKLVFLIQDQSKKVTCWTHFLQEVFTQVDFFSSPFSSQPSYMWSSSHHCF